MEELLRLNKMGPAVSKHAHNQSSPRIMGANTAWVQEQFLDKMSRVRNGFSWTFQQMKG